MTTTESSDTPLEAQPATPPTPPVPTLLPEGTESTPEASIEKSPVLAMLLAFIPFGLGHMYLGLYNRALLFFGAFWFSIYLEATVFAFFFFFFTIIDAFRQAQLLNRDVDESSRPGKGALGLGVFLLVIGTVLLLRNWIDIDLIRDFLATYSPVLLIIAGIYFIFDAVRERSRRSEDGFDGDSL